MKGINKTVMLQSAAAKTKYYMELNGERKDWFWYHKVEF